MLVRLLKVGVSDVKGYLRMPRGQLLGPLAVYIFSVFEEPAALRAANMVHVCTTRGHGFTRHPNETTDLG